MNKQNNNHLPTTEANPLWCVISISDATEEAWVVGAFTTKKECQDNLFYLRWFDRINGNDLRYAIAKEDEIFNFGKETAK